MKCDACYDGVIGKQADGRAVLCSICNGTGQVPDQDFHADGRIYLGSMPMNVYLSGIAAAAALLWESNERSRCLQATELVIAQTIQTTFEDAKK